MKGTKHFKETIENHLKERASKSLLFMKKFKNPEKNIDDCVKYILTTVQKSGSNGFHDDEIFNMATHYYDEADIEVGSGNISHVVVNHQIELSEEEREKLVEQARQQVIQEEMDKMRGKAKKKTETMPPPVEPGTLF